MFKLVYVPFLISYRNYFEFPIDEFTNREGIKICNSRICWGDPDFVNLMRRIVGTMQPRFDEADTILVNELDEFLEIIFIIEGSFRCGYTLNGQRNWAIQFNGK